MAGRQKVLSTSWLLTVFVTAVDCVSFSTSTSAGPAADLRNRESGGSQAAESHDPNSLAKAAAISSGHPPSLSVRMTTNEAWRRALRAVWDHGLSSVAFCLGGSRSDPSPMLSLLANSFQIAAADPLQGEVCGNDTIIQGRLCSASEIGEYYKVIYEIGNKCTGFPHSFCLMYRSKKAFRMGKTIREQTMVPVVETYQI